MVISLICLIVSLAVLLLVITCGAIGGLRKGALHSLVKLVALVLSVVIALIVSLCLRSLLANSLQGIIPSALQEYQALVELIVQIPASIALLLVFWVVFTIVRLLMLIPQSIVCRLLPKTHEAFTAKAKKTIPAQSLPPIESTPAVLTDTPEGDMPANVSDDVRADLSEEAAEDTLEKRAPTLTESTPPEARHSLKWLWQGSAALCGALSSLLLLGAALMPISGMITRGGNALYRVTDVMAKENYGEYADEISEYAHAISTAPLFTVTDFFYGKTVFEPLTSFSTEHGRINLSTELENAADIVCDLLPAAIHLSEEGNIRDEDIGKLTASAEQLAQSRFMLSVGTYASRFAGDQLAKSDPQASQGKQALQTDLGAVMRDMTPDALSDDLKTLAALVEALADSPILSALTEDDRSLALSDLVDRATMRDAFGILYDNDHTKQLIVPLINWGTETIMTTMNAPPVYSTVDIDKVSRDEILDEADRLCDVAEELAAFTDSVNAEGADISTYQMASAGKALDCLRESNLFGNQYEELVRSLTTVEGSDESTQSLMTVLGDELCTSSSAEELLNSAQSVVIMNKELESGEQKGSENEALVSSMDTLLNHTSSEHFDSLSNISGGYFMGESSTVNAETQAQMTDDYIRALKTVAEQGNNEPALEADAIQVIFDATHGDSVDAFAAVSEAETVNALLASDVAFEMLKILNEEGRDYGIRAKLTEQNKLNIAAAIEASDAPADRKAAVAEFFDVD